MNKAKNDPVSVGWIPDRLRLEIFVNLLRFLALDLNL